MTDVDDGLVDLTINPCTLTITTPHVHQWATEWTSDDTHHWHECTAEGCTLTAGTANSEKGGYKEHDWTAANCTTAKACSICGKTEGSALGHDWADATCTAPKTCKRTGCTATDGSPLGHDWDTVWTIGDDQHWHKCNRTGCTVIMMRRAISLTVLLQLKMTPSSAPNAAKSSPPPSVMSIPVILLP